MGFTHLTNKTVLQDGEIKTACQQTCPTDAIVFGNLKDPTSQISANRKDKRSYLMLGGEPEHKHYGLKTLPNVNYLAKITHTSQKGGDPHH